MKIVPDGNGGFVAKADESEKTKTEIVIKASNLEKELKKLSPELYKKYQSVMAKVSTIYTYGEFLGHLPLHARNDYTGTVEDSRKEWVEHIKMVKYVQPGLEDIVKIMEPDSDLTGALAYVIQADAPFANTKQMSGKDEPVLGTACGAIGIIDAYDFYKKDSLWYASFTLKDARSLTDKEIGDYAGAYLTWVWLRQPKEVDWRQDFETKLKKSLKGKRNKEIIVINDVLPCIKWEAFENEE